MTEVIMPKMGDGMEEGTLVEWLKKEGQDVKSGETIANIQTDKATLEMEAPAAGVLSGILLQEGQTVPVGTPIAAILKSGEKLPEGWGSGKTTREAVAVAPVEEARAEAAPSEEQRSPAVAVASVNGGRVKASPLAKKVAAETGVDLASLTGSGPGGRIVEKDVRAAVGSAPSPKKAAVAATMTLAADRKVALSNLRKITAQRTQQSKQEAPHFYVTVDVDVEKIMALRDFFKEEESGSVSVNDFVILATARALEEMPEANASFGGDHILIHGGIHVGMAVAVDEGLTVAVMRNANAMTLRQVAAASRDLAGRARENKLTLDELTGSTISISNMGMLGVDNFAAIINGPNAAILAVSTAKRVPVVMNDEDEIEVRWRMNVTGSFDHRVVDGAGGAKFMNIVRRLLESPTHLLS
ncbi:MAG: 2-oxo acid dehydrogenase subunit E2 [Armatimonadetes bacterium]|nr:2-oxo acid dehydrogenase subunit E2 [Armatimonadota bacterium]